MGSTRKLMPGERVTRYGKPFLGVGVVEETRGRTVMVLWDAYGDLGALGFHSRSHLRSERYAPMNELRDVRGDMFVVLDEEESARLSANVADCVPCDGEHHG